MFIKKLLIISAISTNILYAGGSYCTAYINNIPKNSTILVYVSNEGNVTGNQYTSNYTKYYGSHQGKITLCYPGSSEDPCTSNTSNFETGHSHAHKTKNGKKDPYNGDLYQTVYITTNQTNLMISQTINLHYHVHGKQNGHDCEIDLLDSNGNILKSCAKNDFAIDYTNISNSSCN
ncbi:hypothetical protein L3V83_15705 [Thiotrichales bacterium 19X7-9]|nr:hypothetical protein [Thiotrichales bacterium 19X7-9]